jgi:hypothetical protein
MSRHHSKKTGILLIEGNEEKDSTRLIGYRKEARDKLIMSLSGNVVDVVGTPEGGVEMDSIEAHWKKMAAEVDDEIILITFFHGRSESSYHSGPVWQSGVEKTDNIMRLSPKTNYDASNFYGQLADDIKADPLLRSKKLKIFHVACHGEAATDAVTQLPPGTQIMLFSNVQQLTWTSGYQLGFIEPYWDKQAQIADGHTLLKAAFLKANHYLDKDKYNNPKLITVLDEPSDTLSFIYNENRRTLCNQGHAARIIDPQADVFYLKGMNVKQGSIARAFKKETRNLITNGERIRIVNAFNELKTQTDLDSLGSITRDGIFLMCASYFLQHPKKQESVLYHNFVRGMNNYHPEGDYYNQPQTRKNSVTTGDQPKNNY